MPNEEFLAPSGLPEPFPSVADDVMARAAGAVTDAALRDVTSPIRDAHGELEDALMRIHREGRPGAQDVDSFLRPSGAVQAVAIGLGEPGSAFAPGSPPACRRTWTASPSRWRSAARSALSDGSVTAQRRLSDASVTSGAGSSPGPGPLARRLTSALRSRRPVRSPGPR